MNYQIYEAPPGLQAYVRYFWTIDYAEDGGKDKAIKILADRFPRLIFQNLDGHIATKTENGIVLPTAFLSGIITRQTHYLVKGSYSHLGVSFYPHAMKALFGIDAHELTDTLPDLVNFCSAELIEKLYDAAGHQQRVDLLIQYLLSRLSRKTIQLSAINWMIHSPLDRLSSVDEILNVVRMSERSLERLFKAHLGISPKKYLRILRFEKAVEMLNQSKRTNLSSLAYAIGYSDQAHFNRDFKEFSGLTPRHFQNQVKVGREASSFLLES
ncbi:helix-turn-helix domain-containing protein [Pedobacter yulinensis]|nr:helix-turn-helix domain-containing protein [Pedobacter yulinensis]